MSIYNVIAYLLTDGGIDYHGRIYLANNDDVVIEDFKQQVINTFGNVHFGYSRARNSRIVRFSNHQIKNLLLQYSPSYRTRPCNVHPRCHAGCSCNPETKLPPARIPEKIMNAHKNIKKEFLMRIFTADGGPVLTYRRRGKHIETRRMVVLRCNHPVLLNSLKKLLSEFVISFRTNGTQIQIERIESLKKFRDNINFLPGATVGRGKRWIGVEKSKVLDKMLM